MTKSKNHIDREDFHISAGDNCSLVSLSTTFTAVKTIGKHRENFKEVFSLTKTQINTFDLFPQLLFNTSRIAV